MARAMAPTEATDLVPFEATHVVSAATILNIVKCVEDLQTHMAFVVSRLQYLESREQPMNPQVPTADPRAQLEDASGALAQPWDGNAVAAIEAHLCAHAREIEGLKLSVGRLSDLPQTLPQDTPKSVPESSPLGLRLARQHIALTTPSKESGTGLANVGSGDEAAGNNSPELSSALWSPTISQEDEVPEERSALPKAHLRREFCKASSPMAATRKMSNGFSPKRENTWPSRQSGIWHGPEEICLKAALDVVERLPSSCIVRAAD